MTPERINHRDVQALFRGFDKRWPVGRFFYCHFDSAAAGIKLMSRVGPVTSFRDLSDYPPVAVNAALTYPGLAALDLNPAILQSFPGDFRQGMASRAGLNGDVDRSAPEHWDEYWRSGEQVHIWVGVYSRSPQELDQWSGDFEQWVSSADGVQIVGSQSVQRFWSDDQAPMHIEDPSTNPDGSVVLEHFGFRDGVSQPCISGLNHDVDDVKQKARGGGKFVPKKGWQPINAGEFLLGYVDEMGEIPVSPVPPTLATNGSFLVQRKLEQDVDGFREYLAQQATKLSATGRHITADFLAEKMMGRRRDGTPFAETEKLNDFRFKDDLSGQKCPMGSHMRRANPRDGLGMSSKVCERFGTTLVDRHRILRRAITYGNLVPHGQRQDEVNPEGRQGLMFMTLQTDITRQFEFVQQMWVNFGNDANQGNDRDPIVGTADGVGRMTIPGDAETPTIVCGELPQFVTTRGGDYFFMPSVEAFRRLAEGRFTTVNVETM